MQNSLLLFVSTPAHSQLLDLRTKLTQQRPRYSIIGAFFVVLTATIIITALQINVEELVLLGIMPGVLAIVFFAAAWDAGDELKLLGVDPANLAAKHQIKGIYNAQNVSPLSLIRSAAVELDGPNGFATLRESLTALYKLRRDAVLSGDEWLAATLTDEYLRFYDEVAENLDALGKVIQQLYRCRSYCEINEIAALTPRLISDQKKCQGALHTITDRITDLLATHTSRVETATLDGAQRNATARKALIDAESTALITELRDAQ